MHEDEPHGEEPRAASRDVWRQCAWSVRFDWGISGARELVAADSIAVVVDTLSFTTTTGIAVEAGVRVWPHPWPHPWPEDDRDLSTYAAERGAILAVGRSRGSAGAPSLSPAQLTEWLATHPAGPADPAAPADSVARPDLVLPSPNGSRITAALADSSATVVAASLRNARAVGTWVRAHRRSRPVCVIASGEQWPDGSLRPALEDLYAAGAVLSHLGTDLSPEARTAVAAFRSAESDLPAALSDCASGIELVRRGFADDVRLAAELDVSDVVPVLVVGRFTRLTS